MNPRAGILFSKSQEIFETERKDRHYRAPAQKGFSFVALFKHHTSAQTIIQEMNKAGYGLLSSADFLPAQTVHVFGLKQTK